VKWITTDFKGKKDRKEEWDTKSSVVESVGAMKAKMAKQQDVM
jgi:hypothetical protein